ncbi:hypothetical protein [Sphingomonas abietis]|uniref:Uncharacterized protein n=1 Tax=Sphingomonas abietis TaxID=3012344 RepID=A0ABY7NJS9_9SPHN|nr:hypothetical protein [Sphingomonas abietis]WBO20776.1 hypothetical protein PBT88_11175 [Sphingomonas abietis]
MTPSASLDGDLISGRPAAPPMPAGIHRDGDIPMIGVLRLLIWAQRHCRPVQPDPATNCAQQPMESPARR